MEPEALQPGSQNRAGSAAVYGIGQAIAVGMGIEMLRERITTLQPTDRDQVELLCKLVEPFA